MSIVKSKESARDSLVIVNALFKSATNKGIDEAFGKYEPLNKLSGEYIQNENTKRAKDIEGVEKILKETSFLGERVSKIGIDCLNDENYNFKEAVNMEVKKTILELVDFLSLEDKVKMSNYILEISKINK